MYACAAWLPCAAPSLARPSHISHTRARSPHTHAPITHAQHAHTHAHTAADLFESRKDVSVNVARRPEAIHVYGVDLMSTKDLLNYFGDYGEGG